MVSFVNFWNQHSTAVVVGFFIVVVAWVGKPDFVHCVILGLLASMCIYFIELGKILDTIQEQHSDKPPTQNKNERNEP